MGQGWIRRIEDEVGGLVVPTRPTLVLFDVDGTLLDSAALISDTLINAFLAAGEVAPDAESVRATIGLSIAEMIEALAPGLDRDRRDKILNGYRLRYCDLAEHDEVPPVYAGASEALTELSAHGLALGLATGKARRSLQYVLTAMAWTRHFQTIQCADANPSKPSPVMVHRALQETGRTARDAILVGDSRYDMRMARAAGITPVGVSWGYSSPEVLRAEGAVEIAEDFDDLVAILMRMDAKQGALVD